MSPIIQRSTPDEKLALLDGLDDALTGRGPADPEAEPLRRALAERGLPPRHALDLLDAFRIDARKPRYADWADLMDYCALSAMPVGRFVLDVHGEDAASDLAAVRSRSARRCKSSTISRTAARTTAVSIASTSRSTASPRMAQRVEALGGGARDARSCGA